MKKIFLAVPVISLSVSAQAAKFDPPNLSLEGQMHRQYIRQRAAQSPRIDENYSIRKGETLGSLSEMLYGDAQYWPRVWAQGKQLANPHLIRPGHQLQFLPGSEDETPAFRFSEDGDQSGVELAASTQNAIVEIPPPEVPPKPVLKVPRSFPEWQSIYKQQPDNFLDDRGLKDNRQKIPDQIFLRGYVQEQPVTAESIGGYLENDNEAGLPITNQYVYVKVKKGAGRSGQRLLVVKDGGRLMRLNKQWEPKNAPYLVQITAEIELRELTPAKFNSSDREKFDAYRALVIRATGLSARDCVLIPGQLQTVTLDNVGSSGSVEAQVIGSEKHQASALFAPGDLVFLDKGSSNGVEVGQLLSVYADRSIRHRNAEVIYSSTPSATIKVVKVANSVATAILLNALDSVQQGDVARQLARHADGGEELERAVPAAEEPEVDIDDALEEL